MGQNSRKKKQTREQREQEREAALRQLRARIEPVREKYANDWSEGHATRFETEGHYQWMADFVKGRSLVLEVGTGDGAATLALLVNGATVVSIESNPHCLERAHQKLIQAGVHVSREQRESLMVNDTGRAEIRWGKVTSRMPGQGVLLLGGDIVTDAELKSWLLQQQRFDAVVCWNIGASAIENTVARNEAEYRLIVQNKVYDLADQVLKSEGVLHIVDRGRELLPGQEQEQHSAMIEGHQDQASTTSLQVGSNIQIRSYTPPSAGSGVKMIALDTTKFAHDPNKGAFWSIVSTKP